MPIRHIIGCMGYTKELKLETWCKQLLYLHVYADQDFLLHMQLPILSFVLWHQNKDHDMMTRLWSVLHFIIHWWPGYDHAAMIGTFYNTLMTRLWSAMIGTTFYNTLGLLISNQYRSRDCVGDHQTGCSGEDGNYIGDLGLFISTKTLFWWIITYTFSSKIICPNL